MIELGHNNAPIKPFLDLRDKLSDSSVEDHYLVKGVRDKYTELMSRHQDAWREMIVKGKINGLFIQGEQVLHINSFTGMPSVKPVDAQNINDIRSVNKMQYYSTNWQAKWYSSNPDILVEALSNNDEAIAQARKANRVVDYLERGWYDPFFRLHEGLNAQIWGWYGRRLKLDYTSKAFSQIKKIVEDVETPIGKAYGKCYDCGYTGEEAKKSIVGLKEMTLCPDCESAAYEYDEPIMQLMPKETGQERIFFPEVKCGALYFPSTRFDMSVRMEESSWMITETEISEAALHKIIGNIRFPEGESADTFGLEAIQDLAKRGVAQDSGAPSSAAGKEKKQPYTLTEMYLGPEELYDIKIGGDERTVEGNTLPKGKRMSDVYEHAYIIGINGLSLVPGILADHHSKSCASGMYHLKSMSGTGRGVDDPVQTQRQINRREAQKDKFLRSRATPAILIAEGLLPNPAHKQQLKNGDAIIPIPIQNFPDIKDPRSLIFPMQGQDIPPGLIHDIEEHQESILQTQWHITNFATGNPRADNNTLGGAEILEQNADDLFTPSLGIKADVCLKIGKNGFYMWCETAPSSRFIPFKSKTGSFGDSISGEEVNAEYNWSYVEGSEAPKNKNSELKKKLFFYSQFGGIGGYLQAKAQAPQDVAELERDFDMQNVTEAVNEIAETCRVRWNAAQKLMHRQMSQQMESNQVGMDYLRILADVNPSMLPTEPGLDRQVLWFQDLLIAEEGRQMTDEERDLVSAFVLCLTELFKGQTIKMQLDAAEVQMAAQKPIMDAQAEQEQTRIAAEAQGQAVQMEAEQQKLALEAHERDKERAHASDAQDEQTILKLAEMAHQKGMQASQQEFDRNKETT